MCGRKYAHAKPLEAKGKRKRVGKTHALSDFGHLVLFKFYKHGLVLKLIEAIKIKNNKKLQCMEELC